MISSAILLQAMMGASVLIGLFFLLIGATVLSFVFTLIINEIRRKYKKKGFTQSQFLKMMLIIILIFIIYAIIVYATFDGPYYN